MRLFLSVLIGLLSTGVLAQPFLPPDQMDDLLEPGHASGAPATPTNLKEFALWEILASYDLKKKVVSKELKEKLDKEVLVAGFIIPLDFEAQKVSEFLLVPYVPSCAHVPPPTENQIVHVKITKGDKIEPSMFPMVIKGKLTMAKIDQKKKKDEDAFLPDASFEISATEVKEYSN